MKVRAALVLATAATCSLGLAYPATAASPVVGTAATPLVADWSMNEAPGAGVLVDSGTAGVNGQIGSEVETGVVGVDATVGHRFARLVPNTPPAHPQHLVTVPDTAFLDPGTADFYAVEIKYRTKNKFGNLIQKGQSGSKGGQWKIQLPVGRPSCYFKGSLGRVGAGSQQLLNDNQWHVLRCEHTPSSTTLYVDGVRAGRKNGATGTIDNSVPLTIAGKSFCDQVKITCDYFGGDIDYVRIEKS